MLIRIKQYNTGNVALVMALFFCVIAANCVKKSSPAFHPPVYPAGGTGGMGWDFGVGIDFQGETGQTGNNGNTGVTITLQV